jgi:hypothetical protein
LLLIIVGKDEALVSSTSYTGLNCPGQHHAHSKNEAYHQADVHPSQRVVELQRLIKLDCLYLSFSLRITAYAVVHHWCSPFA